MSTRKTSPRNGQPLPRGKPFTRETAREAAQKRHANEAERRSIADAFRRCMQDTFTDKDGNEFTGAELIAAAIMDGAATGNAKLVEIALGLMGEKPVDAISISKPDFSALDAAFAMMEKKPNEKEISNI